MLFIYLNSEFWGFISPNETNKILRTKPTGTFFFRFSSVPGCYSLSVNNQGQIGHWRIVADKSNGHLYFWINQRKYESLQNLVEVHLIEPLQVKEGGSQNPIILERPLEREANKIGQTETMYSEIF